MINMYTKYNAIAVNPTGNANLAYSRLVIFNFPAAIMLGMFPGINIPPLIIKPMRIALIVGSCPCMEGETSAAAKVALSKIADNILIQYKINGLRSNR